MGSGLLPSVGGEEPRRYKMHAPREAFCISFLLSAFNFLLLFPCGEPRRYKMHVPHTQSTNQRIRESANDE